jgi:hypothetical protein
MRLTLLVCAAVGVLLTSAMVGCKKSGADAKPAKSQHETIAEDMIGKMREMVALLKGMKDESSAKDAKPKLTALKTELDALKAKADALGDPPAESAQRWKDQYEKQVQQVTGELMEEFGRVSMDPKLAPYVDGLMS